MWFVCVWYVVCMWFVCVWYVFGMCLVRSTFPTHLVLPGVLPGLLREELERALLRGVARGPKACKGLLAGRMGLAGDDATLVHHQVSLLEAAGRVVRRAVHDLDTRANGHVGTTGLTTGHRVVLTHVLATVVAVVVVVHAVVVHAVVHATVVAVVVHVIVHSVSNETTYFFQTASAPSPFLTHSGSPCPSATRPTVQCPGPGLTHEHAPTPPHCVFCNAPRPI